MEQGIYNGAEINFIVLTSELTYSGRDYLVYFNNALWNAHQDIRMSDLSKGSIIITNKVVDANIPKFDELLK